MDPYIGEIRMVAFNYAPQGWATCDGQLLSISQNATLYSLLGITYGGNGVTTFALPDLRGRASLHQGSGGGLSPRSMGERGGEESVALTANQMPGHTHQVSAPASSSDPNASDPTGAIMANSGTLLYADSGSANASMAPANSTVAGGSQPHDNMQPYLVVNYIIALQGIYPPRQ